MKDYSKLLIINYLEHDYYGKIGNHKMWKLNNPKLYTISEEGNSSIITTIRQRYIWDTIHCYICSYADNCNGVIIIDTIQGFIDLYEWYITTLKGIYACHKVKYQDELNYLKTNKDNIKIERAYWG